MEIKILIKHKVSRQDIVLALLDESTHATLFRQNRSAKIDGDTLTIHSKFLWKKGVEYFKIIFIPDAANYPPFEIYRDIIGDISIISFHNDGGDYGSSSSYVILDCAFRFNVTIKKPKLWHRLLKPLAARWFRKDLEKFVDKLYLEKLGL
jgi:hypothetical protein